MQKDIGTAEDQHLPQGQNLSKWFHVRLKIVTNQTCFLKQSRRFVVYLRPQTGYPGAEKVDVSEQLGQDENKKKKKPRFFETKQKGDRGFIEGW